MLSITSMRVVSEVVTSPPPAATSGPGAILVTPELPPPVSLQGKRVIRLGDLMPSQGLKDYHVAFVIVSKGIVTSFYKRNDDKASHYLSYVVKCLISGEKMRLVAFNQGITGTFRSMEVF